MPLEYTCQQCARTFTPKHRGNVDAYCSTTCARLSQSRPLIDRFHAKFTPGAPDACWEWQGAHDRKGYGRIGSGGRKGHNLGAHRVAYTFAYGSIPDGLFVLHRCDNPPCVNPAHLFLGTNADNLRDMASKHRHGGPRLKGEANPRAKLTDDQVRTIRARWASGSVTMTELAAIYGVSRTVVSSIVLGKRWTHVT